jgi:anti-sigma factor RsiW
MNHLTDEQLAARLDGSRSPDAEGHLAGCEECRARLAELSSLDDALARALDHDPGEAYFASFADRVAARIAQDAAPAPASATADVTRRGLFGWWNSPRALAWAGGAVAVVAVAALAVVITRDHGVRPLAGRTAPSEVGSTAAPHGANELRATLPPERGPGVPQRPGTARR